MGCRGWGGVLWMGCRGYGSTEGPGQREIKEAGTISRVPGHLGTTSVDHETLQFWKAKGSKKAQEASF
jgi:hypothetical protein